MRLIHGTGSLTTGACWMSAIKWYAHPEEAWGDDPECVDPVIRQFCIWLNDHTREADMERAIGPHLFAPLGTWRGTELSLRRGHRCADFAVRVLAPRAFRFAGLDAEAPRLEALAPVVDEGTARAAALAAEAGWGVAQTAEATRAAEAVARALGWAAKAARAAAAQMAAQTAVAATRVLGWVAARAALAGAQSEVRAEALGLILELCEMGREEPETCRTKEQTLACLEVGDFTK